MHKNLADLMALSYEQPVGSRLEVLATWAVNEIERQDKTIAAMLNYLTNYQPSCSDGPARWQLAAIVRGLSSGTPILRIEERSTRDEAVERIMELVAADGANEEYRAVLTERCNDVARAKP